ncbi:hypothetical protein HAX54_045893 [Datura stramonium]|uniref:Uncharacterized protein n=1 Tax=Datura stramonium TaxID=4076 RepID=A0ABS8SR82_DATST|nr:hypothetical protein [Datura stramonium]
MTSLSEADLYVTIPKFSILDIRPDTKPEMKLMLGSCIDAHRQNSPETDVDFPTSTMVVMDCRWRLASRSFVLRIQQPRILVVPDFLLSVCEFFVPSLGAMTGREEIMDPKNDPISKMEEKRLHSSGIQHIITIGRGKRLRFVNVKIENGLLLRRYTYLSNESSYSVCQEDGVDVIISNSNSDNDESMKSGRICWANLDASDFDPNGSSMQQKKIYGLGLVKDLTVEADSGLIILDPVDISGGYTSVKDKTNISLLSTDICAHLSLGVVSLLLNLQNQATTALHFGSEDPCCLVLSLIEFGTWAVPEQPYIPGGPEHTTMLFWEIVSHQDSNPPSQAVVAVSNMYGRVRKPLDFRLIGLFSDIHDLRRHKMLVIVLFGCLLRHLDMSQWGSDLRPAVSIWRPIRRPGFAVLGDCITEGLEPPPLGIIFKADNPELSLQRLHYKVAHIMAKDWKKLSSGSRACAGAFGKVDNQLALSLHALDLKNLLVDWHLLWFETYIDQFTSTFQSWYKENLEKKAIKIKEVRRGDAHQDNTSFVALDDGLAKGLPVNDDGNSHNFSALCFWLWRIRIQINKKLFPRVQGPNV